MEYGITVYMDQRDVTPWITHVEIDQVDSIHRKFRLTFAGWHSFDETNRWDIFESYDPVTNPRAENVIRQGVIPADRQRLIRIESDAVPGLVAEGYEYIWMAKRRAPSETIVMVPSTRNIDRDVGLALANYKGEGEVGTYRVWPGVRSLHVAVKKLMAAARIRVQVRIPDYDMAPYVIDPSLSYWKAVESLTEPFAPVRYFIRSSNTLMIADPTATIMGSGSVLNIPADSVNVIDVQADRLRRIRRVMMRKTRWR